MRNGKELKEITYKREENRGRRLKSEKEGRREKVNEGKRGRQKGVLK